MDTNSVKNGATVTEMRQKLNAMDCSHALEAFVGLIVEITFIATLTQRFFGK